MNESKAKEETKQTTPEEAKAILVQARQKDAQDCLAIIDQALKKYRCAILATINIGQGSAIITVQATGNNLRIDIVPVKE